MQAKNNFIRDNLFLWFSLLSSPIRRSPLIVCVIYVPTFDEVLAVDRPFGKKILANPLSSGGLGAGGT